MTDVILDTNVASILSPFKHFASLRPVYEQAAFGRLNVLSVQTVAELYLWAKLRNWGARQAELQLYIDGFTLAPCDVDLAPTWASVVAHSRAVGKPLSTADAWVAATALYFGLELLTHDRDFVDLKIPGLKVTCFA